MKTMNIKRKYREWKQRRMVENLPIEEKLRAIRNIHRPRNRSILTIQYGVEMDIEIDKIMDDLGKFMVEEE